MAWFRNFCGLGLAMVLSVSASPSPRQQPESVLRAQDPKIIGAMKEVMWGGHLTGKLDLDTVSTRKHLYGLGPVEFLKGEILVLDGVGYRSEVVADTSMKVTKTWKMKAPFFGYAHIEKWIQVPLPDSVSTLDQLQDHLDRLAEGRPRPYFFKIEAMMDRADIHVVNLPDGARVASPEDAHRGQRDFGIRNQAATLLGFFSRDHRAIFTHHDTFLHIHMITQDKKGMGHLDGMSIRRGTGKLYLPK